MSLASNHRRLSSTRWRFVLPNAIRSTTICRRRASPKPCTANQRYLLKRVMRDPLETRLIEALKSVDAHGDVAPAHAHDPMTMLLRENAIQAHLVRWDDVRGRYVLTGTGRRRISAGSRTPGTVVSFKRRGVVGTDSLVAGALTRRIVD